MARKPIPRTKTLDLPIKLTDYSGSTSGRYSLIKIFDILWQSVPEEYLLKFSHIGKRDLYNAWQYFYNHILLGQSKTVGLGWDDEYLLEWLLLHKSASAFNLQDVSQELNVEIQALTAKIRKYINLGFLTFHGEITNYASDNMNIQHNYIFTPLGIHTAYQIYNNRAMQLLAGVVDKSLISTQIEEVDLIEDINFIRLAMLENFIGSITYYQTQYEDNQQSFIGTDFFQYINDRSDKHVSI